MTIRVLHVLHQGGGAGSVTSTLHLSDGLRRAGFGIRFACPPDSEVEAEARARGLDVFPLPLRAGQRRANAAALAGLLDRVPVDLVNSQSARDREALTWLALSGRLRVPLVVTRRQMPRTFILENWLASRASARVIAVSSAVAAALRRKGTPARKLVVIPNGLIVERVDSAASGAALGTWRAAIGWSPAQRTIGIVARPKDQAVVIEALKFIQTPVRLVLAGVDATSDIGHRAGRVPPRHAVVCLPYSRDVRPLYDLLELVLLPSRIEGLSQSLLEAMALGKPVIASAAAGNVDLIDPEVNGLLVPPLDARAWASAIERLLGDPAIGDRLGTAARRTARETFSLERTIERTGALYASLVASPPIAPSPRGR
ncbi:MAG: glycosyltransferase family 4 protein [Gemmatimonadales bacterium]